MRILLFGKEGQLGSKLPHDLSPLGELIAVKQHGEDQNLVGELTDLDGIRQSIRTVQPDLIVNAAAYTAVDKAEEEPELAMRVNSEAPGVMAEEAARLGSWILHYSTDYVFDGSGSKPFQETDQPKPLNVYGRTKLDGELAVADMNPRHLIIRTSWVYSDTGSNFIATMLSLMSDRQELKVIDDQIGAPTSAGLISRVSAQLAEQISQQAVPVGTYHLTANGETSWYQYAQLVRTEALTLGFPLAVENLRPISSDQWPTAAERPLNSRLDTGKLRQLLGVQFPDWRDEVKQVIRQMLTRGNP